MMNIKIAELMTERVMTATPHQSFAHVRQLMQDHNVSCLPVAGPEGEPVGIITTRDLLGGHADGTPVSQFMTSTVYTVPLYGDPSLAARVMRNHHIHHVIVTHERQIAGILSAFDLLKLVEDHRFTMKNPPTVSSRKGGRRKKDELAAEVGGE